MNIVNRIRRVNEGRDADRVVMKYSAMRTNPFVFFRGTCHLFYDRLPKTGIFNSAPPVWSCGDLHLENFGSYKGDNRLVYFDINDFDEAALAPATWDLARMITSILVGANSYGISNTNARALGANFLFAYVTALTKGKARWVERETSHGVVKELLNQLQYRNRIDFLNGRTQRKGKFRRFSLDGKKTLPVTEKQRTEVGDTIRRFAESQSNPSFFNIVDVARRVAGTGSLGVDRYAIIVEGKGSPDQNYLLDLKQVQPSTIAKHLHINQPIWCNEAERVVTIQQRMQAVSMAFLHPIVVEGRSYVLRALQPSEDRVPLIEHRSHIDHLVGLVQVMGQCVAWAHLRSTGRQGSAITDALIGFSEKKKWRETLLDSVYEFAIQGQNDWKTYSEAYDDGAFQIPPSTQA